MVIATNKIGKLERYRTRSKTLIFIVIMLVILPLMKKTLDLTRTAYHRFVDDGLSSIDIVDRTIHTSSHIKSDENIITDIHIKLELKDYSVGEHNFKVRVYFPDELIDILDKEYYELEESYWTHGYGQISEIEGNITLKLNKVELEKLERYLYGNKDIEYELLNKNEKIKYSDKNW